VIDGQASFASSTVSPVASAVPADIDPELLELLNEPLPFEKPVNKRTQQERSPDKMDVGTCRNGCHIQARTFAAVMDSWEWNCALPCRRAARGEEIRA
jgi:hypothetical protein